MKNASHSDPEIHSFNSESSISSHMVSFCRPSRLRLYFLPAAVLLTVLLYIFPFESKDEWAKLDVQRKLESGDSKYYSGVKIVNWEATIAELNEDEDKTEEKVLSSSTTTTSTATSTTTSSTTTRTARVQLGPSKQPRKSEKCPNQPTTLPTDTSIIPQFKLSPNKYLIPALLWGPSNQLYGIRESIALAIKFNRTLVLPKMYRHYADPGITWNNVAIDPALRISVQKLRELIPVIYISEINKLCPNGPDAIFPARNINLANKKFHIRYLHFFDRYQADSWFLTDYDKLGSDGPVVNGELDDYGLPDVIEEWPFLGKVYPRLGEIEAGDTLKKPNWADKRWNEFQNAPEKCAVRSLPMMSLDFWGGKDTDLHIDARDMFHFTSVHTGAPEYVDELIEDFQRMYASQETVLDRKSTESVIKIPLEITLHWRFNKADWSSGAGLNCAKLEWNNMTSCVLVAAALNDPLIVAKTLLYYARDTVKDFEDNHRYIVLKMLGIDDTGGKIVLDPLSIYIATPPQDAEYIGRVAKLARDHALEVESIHRIQVLSSVE